MEQMQFRKQEKGQSPADKQSRLFLTVTLKLQEITKRA